MAASARRDALARRVLGGTLLPLGALHIGVLVSHQLRDGDSGKNIAAQISTGLSVSVVGLLVLASVGQAGRWSAWVVRGAGGYLLAVDVAFLCVMVSPTAVLLLLLALGVLALRPTPVGEPAGPARQQAAATPTIDQGSSWP